MKRDQGKEDRVEPPLRSSCFLDIMSPAINPSPFLELTLWSLWRSALGFDKLLSYAEGP